MLCVPQRASSRVGSTRGSAGWPRSDLRQVGTDWREARHPQLRRGEFHERTWPIRVLRLRSLRRSICAFTHSERLAMTCKEVMKCDVKPCDTCSTKSVIAAGLQSNPAGYTLILSTKSGMCEFRCVGKIAEEMHIAEVPVICLALPGTYAHCAYCGLLRADKPGRYEHVVQKTLDNTVWIFQIAVVVDLLCLLLLSVWPWHLPLCQALN